MKDRISSLFNNSTWITEGVVYKFLNGKDLWINGNLHTVYTVSIINGKVSLCFENMEFAIDYIDDCTLILIDKKGNSFRITKD